MKIISSHLPHLQNSSSKNYVAEFKDCPLQLINGLPNQLCSYRHIIDKLEAVREPQIFNLWLLN